MHGQILIATATELLAALLNFILFVIIVAVEYIIVVFQLLPKSGAFAVRSMEVISMHQEIVQVFSRWFSIGLSRALRNVGTADLAIDMF